MKNSVLITISARMRSERLPGKALSAIGGVPSLAYLIRNLKSLRDDYSLVVCTGDDASNWLIADIAMQEEVEVFQGSEPDVLNRLVEASKFYGGEYVVRITADCPFVTAKIVRCCVMRALEIAEKKEWAVLSTKGVFPVGLDVEIVRASSLIAINEKFDLTEYHREHVTSFFYEHNAVEYMPEVGWLGGLDETTSFLLDDLDDLIRLNAMSKTLRGELPWAQ